MRRMYSVAKKEFGGRIFHVFYVGSETVHTYEWMCHPHNHFVLGKFWVERNEVLAVLHMKYAITHPNKRTEIRKCLACGYEEKAKPAAG